MSGAILVEFADGSSHVVDVAELERYVGPGDGFVELLVELGIAVEVVDGLVQLRHPGELEP